MCHAHVAALHRRVRHEPGGAEEEHVAVEELLRPHDLHAGPGDADLPQLELPALRDVLPQVAEPDIEDGVPAQEPQAHRQGAAHVPQGQEVYPAAAGEAEGLQQLLPAGVAHVHGPDPALLHRLLQLPGEAVFCGQGSEGLGALRGGGRGEVEALPPRQGGAAEEVQDLLVLREAVQGPPHRLLTVYNMVFILAVSHFNLR